MRYKPDLMIKFVNSQLPESFAVVRDSRTMSWLVGFKMEKQTKDAIFLTGVGAEIRCDQS